VDIFRKIPVVKVRDSSRSETEDLIAVERRLKISVNGRPVVSLYCTPVMVRELVAGIIRNEGLISGQWCADRMSIEHGDEILVDVPASGEVYEGERTITSGCAGGVSLGRRLPDLPLTDETRFSAEGVRQVFREFQGLSESYRLTGGVHSAALSDGKNIICFAEDIGRHNAVDKVVGLCLLEHIPLEGTMMLASGRLSSEIVSKCLRSGIPVLASRAAPTSLAVDIASRGNLTMIGFVRGERMNIYTGKERIPL